MIPEGFLEIGHRVGAFLQPSTSACFNSPLRQFLLANRPEALRKTDFASFQTTLQPKTMCWNAWKSENNRFCVKQTIFFNAATIATTPLEWPKILVSYMLHHLSCLYCTFNRWSTKCNIIPPHYVVRIFWPTSGKKPWLGRLLRDKKPSHLILGCWVSPKKTKKKLLLNTSINIAVILKKCNEILCRAVYQNCESQQLHVWKKSSLKDAMLAGININAQEKSELIERTTNNRR